MNTCVRAVIIIVQPVGSGMRQVTRVYPRPILRVNLPVIQRAAAPPPRAVAVAIVTVSLMAKVAQRAVRLHVRRINGTITRKRSV